MTQDSDARARVVQALSEARRARHHSDCYCRSFQSDWCNAADALWSRAYNRRLDELRRTESSQEIDQ